MTTTHGVLERSIDCMSLMNQLYCGEPEAGAEKTLKTLKHLC